MKNQDFRQQYEEPIKLGVFQHVELGAMLSAVCPLEDEPFRMPSLEATAFLENTEYKVVGE